MPFLLSLSQDMGASTPAGRKAPLSSFNSVSEYGRAFVQTPKRFWNRALAVTTPSEEMTEVLLFCILVPTSYQMFAEAATLTAFILWSGTDPFFSLILTCWTDFVSVLGFNKLISTCPFEFHLFLLVMFVSVQQLAGVQILCGSQL